ncbi:MAG: hypothetical protein KAS87_03030 [Candidatus Omnitrophica bacterium]|nr:hypothetical protein [Candidatus Omnitrophota bacterium]
MSTVKEVMTKIIQEQPEDSSFDEVLRELAFAKMVNKGLSNSDAGRVISNKEMKKRTEIWQK